MGGGGYCNHGFKQIFPDIFLAVSLHISILLYVRTSHSKGNGSSFKTQAFKYRTQNLVFSELPMKNPFIQVTVAQKLNRERKPCPSYAGVRLVVEFFLALQFSDFYT